MRVLRYHPHRRGFLKAVGLTLVGAPVVRVLGRVVDRQARRLKRARDLPEVPWIGHC